MDGTDSLWDLALTLEVGKHGTAQLEISSGGRVQNDDSTVGRYSDSDGLVIVRGSGSIWDNRSSLHVGGLGTGTLLVTDGGMVENTDANIGDGVGSNGTLNVMHGGTVANAGDMKIANGTGSTGAVTIHGAGSIVTVGGNLFVGNFGTGTMTIHTGGDLFANNGMILGMGDNLKGYGTVETKVVAAAGSIIEASGGPLTLGDAASTIGFYSDGVLIVGGHSVTLADSNGADLGTLTTITAAGTLNVANGAVLEFSDNLTGEGLINSPTTLPSRSLTTAPS